MTQLRRKLRLLADLVEDLAPWDVPDELVGPVRELATAIVSGSRGNEVHAKACLQLVRLQVGPPEGVAGAVVCKACNGTGDSICGRCWLKAPCERCDGNGYVLEEVCTTCSGLSVVKGSWGHTTGCVSCGGTGEHVTPMPAPPARSES